MNLYYNAYLELRYIFDENVNMLQNGDIIIGMPLPINEGGFDNRIRRAKVMDKNEDKILLCDLDNSLLFYWDLNVRATNNNYIIFLLNNS